MIFDPYKAIQKHNKDLSNDDPKYISDEMILDALYPFKDYKAKKKRYNSVPDKGMWKLSNRKNLQNFKSAKTVKASNKVVTVLVKKFGLSLCSLWR